MARDDCGSAVKPKRVAGAYPLPSTKSCVDIDCVTTPLLQVETVDASGYAVSVAWHLMNPDGTAGAVYTGALDFVPCSVNRVKLVDACDAAAPPPPVANLNIEFSEQLLYSASTEQSVMRIRRYDEGTGAWSLVYENLDGTPFAGALPPDLTARTAQVNVTRGYIQGCANGVPIVMRETSRFDAETGALESELVDYLDSAGAVITTTPAGFALGDCPSVCLSTAPVGVVAAWG
jgi:hypothetical protein